MKKSPSQLSGVAALALAVGIILWHFAPDTTVIQLITGFLFGLAIVLNLVSIWYYAKGKRDDESHEL